MVERFGNYEIQDCLGRGGMATVHRALWLPENRTVALKRLHPGQNVDMLKRFRREIKVISKLAHPNIVRVLDFGQVGEVPFFAMEVVDTENLAARIERCRRQGRAVFQPAEFRKVVEGLSSALEYVHTRGIIHRDLKPSNVFVDNDGSALLCDFGLAHLAQASRLTDTGQVLGTPAYMTPEQMRAGAVDERTDVYQLGLLMYEMLTGGLPFPQLEGAFALANARITRPIPPPSASNPTVEAGMDRVVLRCLAVNPQGRYADMAELRKALGALDRGTLEQPLEAPLSSRPASLPAEPPAKARVLALTGFFSLLGAAGLVFLHSHARVREHSPPGLAPAPSSDAVLNVSIGARAHEALVSFQTASPSRSTLELSGPDGDRVVPVSSTRATFHSTWISGLAEETGYRLRVRLDSEGGRAFRSAWQEFTTGR